MLPQHLISARPLTLHEGWLITDHRAFWTGTITWEADSAPVYFRNASTQPQELCKGVRREVSLWAYTLCFSLEGMAKANSCPSRKQVNTAPMPNTEATWLGPQGNVQEDRQPWKDKQLQPLQGKENGVSFSFHLKKKKPRWNSRSLRIRQCRVCRDP